MNSVKDINTHCLTEFRQHWECLNDWNHQLWQCRPAEWKLNKCVYDNLVCVYCALIRDESTNSRTENREEDT